ncbi:MAG: carboxypeptidase-like regulatory domain-containing protein [Flavobacteriales bacterium]|jgi:hypothetical protein|nr:carboxypeptidase-like regulatory domain-containing protein [Flavobacteriales bacterium]
MRLLLLLFVLVSLSSVAQVVSGVVKDEFNNPLPFTKVVDTTNQTFTMTDFEGMYRIKVKKGSVLKYSYVGKKTHYEQITTAEAKQLKINVKLVTSSKQLGIVEVTSERIKPVDERPNHHILDYIFSGKDQFLILKKIKRQRYLSVDGLDTTFAQFPVDVNVQKIFVDCQQNIHLVGKDSAYQIYLDNKITYISSMSTDDFDEKIAPCILEEFGSFYRSEYQNHNKTVNFYSITKDASSFHLIKTIEDEEYRKSAELEYQKIIGMYNAVTPEFDNIIKMNIWDGDVYSLINVYTSTEFFDQIAFFKQQIAREIVCPHFLTKDKTILVFDHINDEILELKNHVKTRSDFFDFHDSKYYANDILQDKVLNRYYAVYNQKGNLVLKEIDLDNGTTKNVLSLDEIAFPELIKVNNGFLYFVKFQGTGFAKLYRVKLD